ncbi:MAG TPA: hypothetical protein VHZ55_13400 [Bryobacteraceae bacterium]|nr:hypothetical protein [Bryobacteraceae bacterium]
MSATTALPAERLPRLQVPGETVEPGRRNYFSDLIRISFPKQPDALACATMFTAPHPGCGVSFICSYIATEMAAQGGKVLLADAHAIVALTHQDGGIAFQLCERIEPGRVWVLGLQQLSKGRTEAKAVCASVTSILDSLKQEFSVIIIDAPATSASDDALILSTAVYGTVLVAEAGRTEKRQIVESQRRISALGGRVLGSVYNSRD